MLVSLILWADALIHFFFFFNDPAPPEISPLPPPDALPILTTPAIAAARAEGIDANGPWPGDTVFMRARRGEFDVVVAQYHDQGLIPVKYLGVEQGVNITV